MRLRKSSKLVLRHKIAMISEAGVISNPVSVGMPLADPPMPELIMRKLRSLTSITRRHKIRFKPFGVPWLL